MRHSVTVALILCAACGASRSRGGAALADAPREAELDEPRVDPAGLRPDLFGYGAGSTRLALRGCDPPLEYRLGTIDPRFGLGRKQALAALAAAAGYWERGAGRPLFRYSPRSAFTINFVFDERQEMLVEKRERRDPIDQVRRRYQALDAEHDRRLAAYEARRRVYEARVAEVNGQGGAPPELERELRAEKSSLTREREAVNAMLPRVAALAADINSRGRSLGEADYRYLTAGWTTRATRDGMITGIRTDIFMFASWKELSLIAAHELGHALGLEHVPGRGSLMFGGPGPQRQERASPQDLAELERVCPSR